MSELSRVILAAVAASLTLGAVQFASGRDLTGIGQDLTGTPETVVNRIAKADRADRAVAPGVRTQTIALRREGLPDTSFLVHTAGPGDPRRRFRSGEAEVGKAGRGLRARGQRFDRDRQAA